MRNSRENLVNEMAEMRVGSPGKDGHVFGASSPRRALAEMQSPGRRYATNESSDLPDLAAAAAGATTVDQVREGDEGKKRRESGWGSLSRSLSGPHFPPNPRPLVDQSNACYGSSRAAASHRRAALSTSAAPVSHHDSRKDHFDGCFGPAAWRAREINLIYIICYLFYEYSLSLSLSLHNI